MAFIPRQQLYKLRSLGVEEAPDNNETWSGSFFMYFLCLASYPMWLLWSQSHRRHSVKSHSLVCTYITIKHIPDWIWCCNVYYNAEGEMYAWACTVLHIIPAHACWYNFLTSMDHSSSLKLDWEVLKNCDIIFRDQADVRSWKKFAEKLTAL